MAFILGPLLPFGSSRPTRAVCTCNAADGALKAASVIAVAAAAGALLAGSANASVLNFSGTQPSNIGLRSERYLDSCPPTPNCVSSMANVYDSHYVPAWTYATGAEKKSMSEAIADAKEVLDKYEGETVTIMESRTTKSEVGEGYYILAHFQSPFFGFVDDVELFWQPDGKTVEYRSASRLGEGDFDANRKRIKKLRVALQDMGGWASQGY